MGFNNKGVDHLVARLRRARYAGIRGISIGKNADTPLEQARRITSHASARSMRSPITWPSTFPRPTPRACANCRRPAVCRASSARCSRSGRDSRRAMAAACRCWSRSRRISTPQQIAAVAASLRALGVDGVIATNTTTDLTALGPDWPADRRGGLSGAPLHGRSAAVIAQLRAELGASFPIIGVGGIVDGDAGARDAARGRRPVAGLHGLRLPRSGAPRGDIECDSSH